MSILTTVLLACVPVCGMQFSETENAGASSAVKQATGLPPVVDWTKEISLPDDILFVRHQSSAKDALIFLVSLDSTGKVIALRPISGFSLYLNELNQQVRSFRFSPKLASRSFVLRIPDPLQKYVPDRQLYHIGICTSKTDLRMLYQLGAMFWRKKDNSAASHCYKYILDRNPSSVAARYGIADICLSEHDQCADSYLQGLAVSNPEFIEARSKLVQKYQYESDEDEEMAYIANLDRILKLDIALAERAWLLEQQAFWLVRLNKIDEAVQIMKKWNAVASELCDIYPPAGVAFHITAEQFGLVEEGEGVDDDAIASYRLASSIVAFDRLVPDSARYEIDLGLSRTLRKTGHSQQALELCSQWKTKWKKLVSRPVHHPWELRQDGPLELGGRWEFSCGDPQKGLELIQKAIRQYPNSNAPYTALAQYYYSVRNIMKAREAEATASRLLDEWSSRLGESY